MAENEDDDLNLPSWLPAPPELALNANEVHVWRASLDCSPAELSRLETCISADELARAKRFISQTDRNHFLAARGILRELVGRYARVSPAQIQFRYGTNGKPELESNGFALQFNVSHSSGLAVFGFSRERRLGVDVELVRSQSSAEDIAARYFAPDELVELRKLPLQVRAQGFFCCWTRKEAYVKAHGAGLSIPLDSFTVSLTPDQPAELHSADRARWSMRSFEPRPGYVAAIVLEGTVQDMRFWNWVPRY